MLKVYEIICWSIIPAILGLHFIFLRIDDNSKYQKRKLRASLVRIHSYITQLNLEYIDGIKFHELKVIYKNKEFNIGVHKTDHNSRYCYYEIFINGDKAGTLHEVGDSLNSYYYFETENHRVKWEVMAIINVGAKQAKKEIDKRTEKLVKETLTWDNYSYFK